MSHTAILIEDSSLWYPSTWPEEKIRTLRSLTDHIKHTLSISETWYLLKLSRTPFSNAKRKPWKPAWCCVVFHNKLCLRDLVYQRINRKMSSSPMR